MGFRGSRVQIPASRPPYLPWFQELTPTPGLLARPPKQGGCTKLVLQAPPAGGSLGGHGLTALAPPVPIPGYRVPDARLVAVGWALAVPSPSLNRLDRHALGMGDLDFDEIS